MPKGQYVRSNKSASPINLISESLESIHAINLALESRIAALERRIAQMDDAFSRGNLPAPRGHQTLAVQ